MWCVSKHISENLFSSSWLVHIRCCWYSYKMSLITRLLVSKEEFINNWVTIPWRLHKWQTEVLIFCPNRTGKKDQLIKPELRTWSLDLTNKQANKQTIFIFFRSIWKIILISKKLHLFNRRQNFFYQLHYYYILQISHFVWPRDQNKGLKLITNIQH